LTIYLFGYNHSYKAKRKNDFKGGVMNYKKLLSLIIGIVILSIFIQPFCTSGQKQTPAYQRWGITKPIDDTGTEQELVTAYDLFYNLDYEPAKNIYREIVSNYPDGVEGYIGMSMVNRYLGLRMEALADCRKALDLDPDAIAAQLNYADLIPHFRGIETGLNLTDSQRIATSIDYCQKALKTKHPLTAYAHIILFGDYLIGYGGWDKAKEQLIELGKKDYFPSMLKDYAYNLLNTVDADAILFTQGDNDTYPLLSMQEYEGVRQDVSVVNINLLNVPQIAILMRNMFRVPISYNDSILVTYQPKRDSVTGKIILAQEILIKDIIENAPEFNRPVYFSTTVARDNIGKHQENLIFEGLAWRVVDKKTKDSTDIDKVIKNMTEKYRLDNIAEKEVWSTNLSPITRKYKGLGINYIACYSVMTDHYQNQKEIDKAINGYRSMAKIAPAIGREDLMKTIVENWLELKPEDPEAKELKEKYPGGS
jgi:tetratricopeptide (TPR) repeat protein